jgi:aryl-alcohol dehydrogenase-like predicted oxidoreductase
MRTRPLGGSGLAVSELALGTWAFGGDEWGPPDDRRAAATIEAALAAGVTLIDTADVYGYGHSEELVGAVLAGGADDVLVCSKAGNDIYDTPRQAGGGPKSFAAGYVTRAIEGSLRRLRRDRIDVYLLHNPSAEVLAEGLAMGALLAARDAGLVRLVGASVYTADEGRVALDAGADVLMITHNVLNHAESVPLLELASERRCAVLARSVLANGLLTGKYDRTSRFAEDDHRSHRGDAWLASAMEKVDAVRPVAERHGVGLRDLALAYALTDQRLAGVVVGARTPEQLAELVAAADQAPLSGSLLAELDAAELG